MKKTMSPEEFVDYAKEQLAKAKTESKTDSQKRLDALHESTDIAKQSFTSSGRASIPVFTEPTPTANVSPQKAAVDSDGKGHFASNLEDLNGRLAKLKKSSSVKLHGLDDEGFPDDLNDPDFVKKGGSDGPDWGYDTDPAI